MRKLLLPLLLLIMIMTFSPAALSADSGGTYTMPASVIANISGEKTSFDISLDLTEGQKYSGLEFHCKPGTGIKIESVVFDLYGYLPSLPEFSEPDDGRTHFGIYVGVVDIENALEQESVKCTVTISYSGATSSQISFDREDGPGVVGIYKIVLNSSGVTSSLPLDPKAGSNKITVNSKSPSDHTITFSTNGGNTVDPRMVKNNEKLIKPAVDPLRDGYIFDGWYKDAACTEVYNFDSPVTGSFTLYANWKRAFKVTFISNGTTFLEELVADNDTVKKPTDPTRSGYTFAGWYTNPELTDAYDFNTSVTKSFPLYAKWTAVPGGKVGTDPITGEPITDVGDPVDPNKPSGFNILGEDTQGPTFQDVAKTHWAYQYVEYLARKGFVNGKTATLFAPGDPITRAEFVTILARMEGAALTDYDGPFTDVQAGAYYAGAVSWAVEAGVTLGTSATTFTPGRTISRQEIATMLARYILYKEYSLTYYNQAVDFSDGAQIAEYAKEHVSNMQKADIIGGYPDGTFKPLNNATRAEAAKMLALIHFLINSK